LFLGKLATSEKKKDVLIVGVRGVRGTFLGEFNMDASPPPGENK
jgi:hypothetical protein